MRFQPVSHSWVALHPQPLGVIQFIAGAFFGTFGSMFFYRYLLQCLFEQRYTIILLPFNFTFNHYIEAGFLIKEQYEILPELVRMACLEGYDYEAYLDSQNFSWIGHSLGCKYISLLEGFSALPTQPQQREEFIRRLLSNTSKPPSESQIQSTISDINILISELENKIVEVDKLIYNYVNQHVKITNIFIKDQLSILIAPDIGDTASAIKPRFLANFIDYIGWGVKPNSDVTYSFIKESNLFQRVGLICFQCDKIAEQTCKWFISILEKNREEKIKILDGGHLRPLGIKLAHNVLNPFDLTATPVLVSVQERYKKFEFYLIRLLESQ